MNKCPICGSTNLEERHVKDGKTLGKGLPRNFVQKEWVYYLCQQCFEKVKNKNWKGEFVCTFVDNQPYLWVSASEIWLPIGKPLKEVVQFT